MKKFLIFIIIILIVLLLVQVLYNNIKENKSSEIAEENKLEVNNIENDIFNNNITIENQKQKLIIPEGINSVMEQYKGKVSTEMIESTLYDFANINLTQIYDMTTGKSDNKILQIYDLDTTKINQMNIYSKEDFLEIAAQIFMVGNVRKVKCISSNVEESSYKSDENKYTTFNVILNFDSLNSIKLKVYIANDGNVSPEFKLGVDN